MSLDARQAQVHRWNELKERRVFLAVATFAMPLIMPLSISAIGPWAALACLVAWLLLLRATLQARCGRCLGRFADGVVLPVNSHCRQCGSPQFAPPQLFGPFEDPQAVAATTVPPPREMSDRSRRWVGALQAIAGGFVLLMVSRTLMNGFAGVWEFWTRAAFAALAMVGGVALYRGQRSGYGITRFVLTAQLVSFVLPGAAYEMLAGVHGGVRFGSEGVGAHFGWASSTLLWVGDTTGWRVYLNIVALVLLTLIPDPDEPTPVDCGVAPKRAILGDAEPSTPPT